MTNFKFRFLKHAEMDDIVPFIQMLNPDLPEEIIRERIGDMKETSCYQCLGVFDENKLVAICGIWMMTKFYSGKQVEIDNLIILPKYRANGLGKQIMQWIYDYAISQGYESCELNTYVMASKAHKFYFKEGFHIKGYHMQKDL